MFVPGRDVKATRRRSMWQRSSATSYAIDQAPEFADNRDGVECLQERIQSMPSPFPGMDPYLETTDWFPDLRSSLIHHVKARLNRVLPESYYAQSDYRYWFEYSRRYIDPGIEDVRSARKARQGRYDRVVVAEPQPAGPLIVSVETTVHGPFKQAFLEVRRWRGKKVRLITAIEILSPYNKQIGNPSRGQYVERQRQVLREDAHLVEIDLLRGGIDTAAVPRDVVAAKAGPFDYSVSIHRFDQPKDFRVIPISMMQRLPEIPIPLLPGDPDVPVDLQAAFDQAYDIGPFGREIEYEKDRIVPRLDATQAAWAAKLIKKRKRRA